MNAVEKINSFSKMPLDAVNIFWWNIFNVAELPRFRNGFPNSESARIQR